jgi:hypothetical protein
VALRDRSQVFDSALLHALKVDAEASAHARGEIVGLDFDPFVGGQDPADHYKAHAETWKNAVCFVNVWRDSPEDTGAKYEKPDVTAEVILQRGHWKFVDFQYPQVNGDLLSVLKQLAQDRQKH